MRIKVSLLGGWLVAILPVVALLAADNDGLQLLEAVKSRNQQAVRSLLRQSVDVNARQNDGATALAWAAHFNDLETADLLIRAGANVNASDDLGATPLWLACTNGNAAMAEKLLNAGADAKVALATGETALMACARTGDWEGVKGLLRHGADANARETQGGQTALMWAAAQKHPQVVRELIQQGADVAARSKGGFTALLFAARQGDLESARILLEAGANVNEAAADGMPPLLVASASGHEELSVFLLQKGAEPNVADGNGLTALHYALLKGVSVFRNAYAAIDPAYDYFYRPNMRKLAKALLAQGANPNARVVDAPDFDGTAGGDYVSDDRLAANVAPLLLAAVTYDVDVMRMLVEAGADLRLKTKENRTPLMLAAGLDNDRNLRVKRDPEVEARALELVKLAVQLGYDVNAADSYGQTALHGAAYKGMDSVLQFLVEKGAKIDATDQYGQTPLSVAEAVIPKGLNRLLRPYVAHKSSAELLRRLGASVTVSKTQ